MRILVIKLGALGDVVRTLPIVKTIKEKFPESKISWVTKQNAVEILKKTDFIDEIFTLPYSTDNKFDALYNFDIEVEATKLALEIEADKKYGFYDNDGFPTAFNIGAEYYLNTLFDDDLKKSNKKTYQEMMFEVAEIPDSEKNFLIKLSDSEISYGEDFLIKNSLSKGNIIGIHMGASPRWPSKVWDKEVLKEFIRKARRKGYDIILFGGPGEIEEHKQLIAELEGEGIKIYQNNPNNTVGEFISLLDLCDVVLCSDSFSLHISLSLNKKTIGLFFCTSPDEVEGYGLLKKIVSPMLEEFFPEKMDQYSKELTESISSDQVFEELEKLMPNDSL